MIRGEAREAAFPFTHHFFPEASSNTTKFSASSLVPCTCPDCMIIIVSYSLFCSYISFYSYILIFNIVYILNI